MLLDEQENERLEQRGRSGANWFYWIGGLSLVNSVVQFFDSEQGFIIGLGITQIIDGFAKGIGEAAGGGAAGTVRGIGLGLDLVVAGFFVLLGREANDRRAWAFVLGMLIYAFDGLIFLAAGAWLNLGFHAFALFAIWSGYSSVRELQEKELRSAVGSSEPAAPEGR